MTENEPGKAPRAPDASPDEGRRAGRGPADDNASTDLRAGTSRPRWLDACNDTLLADPLITDVTAIRFIRPRILLNALGTNGEEPLASGVRSVVPRTPVDPAAAVRRVAGVHGATWLSAQGGVSLIPAWNHPELLAPATETVPVGDIAELIATQQLPDTGGSVRLDAGDVAALIDGHPALVALPAAEADVLPAKAFETPDRPPLRRYAWLMPPAPSQFEVIDLPAFLADPRTSGGIPLQLTTDNVKELLAEGRSEVPIAADDDGNALVTVIVETSSRDPDPGELVTADGPGSALTVQLAIALRWQQRWQLQGYTRGALLSTISLAPQEQTTIEIFSWDRRRTDSDTNSSVEMNSNIDTSDTVRDTTDVLNETKKTSSLNWSVQAGLTIPIASGVPLTLGGSVQDHNTMDALRRETTNHVHEAVTKSATSVRMSRQSKVNETTEIGSERRVTRTVTNQNLCQVLNLDYFEVLSKYQVKTSFDRAATRICALVPSTLTPTFTRLTVRTHESTLRASLLERDLLDGFEAVRMLAARAHACHVACEQCTCAASPGQPAALSSYTIAAMRTVGQVWNTMQTTKAPAPTGGLDVSALAAARRWMYRFVVEILTPEVANSAWVLLGAGIGVNQRELTREDADRLWWAVTNAGGVDAIRPGKLATERSQLIDDIAFDFFAGQTSGFGQRVAFFSSTLRGIVDDVGMTAALDRFMASFNADPAAAASTAVPTGAPATGQPTREHAVREAFPLRAVTDALEREEALLAHLSNNASHYWYALWQATSPHQQAALLDGLLPPGIVEPWPIGMVDHCLAFPISASTVPSVTDVLDELFGDLEPPAAREDTVTLPTPAVTMEARLGTCHACEGFIRESRRIDLRTRSAAADVAQAEADRRRARLDLSPPDLTSPEPAVAVPRLDVRVEQVPPPANA